MAWGARSGPSPTAVEGSSSAPPGTSAPGEGGNTAGDWDGAQASPGGRGLGRCHAPSPPSPTHQPPVDEVGQAGAGPGAEIPPVRPADLPEMAVSGGSGGDAGPHRPPAASPCRTQVSLPPVPIWPQQRGQLLQPDRVGRSQRGQTDRQPWTQRHGQQDRGSGQGTRPCGGAGPVTWYPLQ